MRRVEPCPGPLLESWLQNAGFTDVAAEKHILPVGTWPANKHLVTESHPLKNHRTADPPFQKEVGAWNYVQIMEGLEASFYTLFTRVLDYSRPEIDVFCAKIRNEMRDPDMRAFFHL